MDRTACINLPFFPVQLLLRRHPDWSDQPVAVVDADKPQGMILLVNERARAFRIRPGMRYAAGLSLARGLRAAVVPEKEIAKAANALGRRLRAFSPRVEPAMDEPGLFWLDASGLTRLYGSLRAWAGCVRADMRRVGFHAAIAVGFSRFGAYALAKSKKGVLVLASPEDEQRAARQVPLDRLALEPETLDVLQKLGIKTVGRFVDLPPAGIAKRFGPAALRLHRLASGALCLPLQPEMPLPPVLQQTALDYPETDLGRLMALIARLLDPLLQKLSARGQTLSEIRIGFVFDRLGKHTERIRPATPTLDARQLLDLIRLRLQGVDKLPDGVVEIGLAAQSAAAVHTQESLFRSRPKRDPAAANRALARVRADLGDGAVVRARLCNGHLPEARFVWEPLDTLNLPEPRHFNAGRLIRRIHKPTTLPKTIRQGTGENLLPGFPRGPVIETFGPYIVSGGWWRRTVHREYYFAGTRETEMLWVYYDRIRGRWLLQGRIE